MPRAAWTLAALLAAVALAVGPSAPVAAAAHGGAGTPHERGVTSPLPGDTSDFTFSSFAADYTLGRDAGGRSTLRTVERLTAVFPERNQNRGIVRAIPTGYRGHPTDVHVVSVTDGDGRPRAFDTDRDDDDFLNVTIAVPKGSFVHGAQTYVITTTQHDVTLQRTDQGDDEFYWDTNGTGWAQPFGSVTARVHVADDLVDAADGQRACYRGAEGATERCAIDADAGVVTATAATLGPHENMTVAIGFRAGTFTARDSSYLASPTAPVQLAGAAAGLLVLVWLIALRRTVFADARGRSTIVAEYAPPARMQPLVAAGLAGKRRSAVAAALIELAVRGVVRVVDEPRRTIFGARDHYVLQLANPSGTLRREEHRLIRALFGTEAAGVEFDPAVKNAAGARGVASLLQDVRKDAVERGERRRVGGPLRVVPIVAAIAACVVIGVAGSAVLSDARGGVVPVLVWVLIPVLFFTALAVCGRSPLTAQGAELRDHLRGLELYIRLAEADRLRVLQSPLGAERTPVDPADRGAVLKLYERLLPYAILFGLEREWSEELGAYYDGRPPDWYGGRGAFNTALFASSIGSVSSSVSTSYSGSASSSSSGGAGGGGFSGGGGGGGGGGGI